jgi:hypothetical protein
VGNSGGAIAHNTHTAGQTRLVACSFADTKLEGGMFLGGSVMVDSCLFAGVVPTMPVRFSSTGTQFNFTTANISFETASMIATCGGIAGITQAFQETKGVGDEITDEIKQVSVHKDFSESALDIELTIFSHIWHPGNGAAIYVSTASAPFLIRNDAFVNCSTAEDGYFGGCAYVASVASGTGVVHCCATRCMSSAGSFVWCQGRQMGCAFELRGLSAFDCSHGRGAFDCRRVSVTASDSNFTDLNGTWGTSEAVAVLCEDSTVWEGSVGSRLHFGCNRGGVGCFCKYSDLDPRFGQCTFVNNSVGAVAHKTTGRTRLTSCYFKNTSVTGSAFDGGWIVADNCSSQGRFLQWTTSR